MEVKKITDSPVMGRIWALLTALLVSYAGYDQYEKSQAAVETTVNVNVEGIDQAPNAEVHSHARVLSREAIEALIAGAIAKQHEADIVIFKQKEEWEK